DPGHRGASVERRVSAHRRLLRHVGASPVSLTDTHGGTRHANRQVPAGRRSGHDPVVLFAAWADDDQDIEGPIESIDPQARSFVVAEIEVDNGAAVPARAFLYRSWRPAHGGNTLPHNSTSLPSSKRAPNVCSSSHAVV